MEKLQPHVEFVIITIMFEGPIVIRYAISLETK